MDLIIETFLFLWDIIFYIYIYMYIYIHIYIYIYIYICICLYKFYYTRVRPQCDYSILGRFEFEGIIFESCSFYRSLSKFYCAYSKKHLFLSIGEPRLGIEPSSPAWQAGILTDILTWLIMAQNLAPAVVRNATYSSNYSLLYLQN